MRKNSASSIQEVKGVHQKSLKNVEVLNRLGELFKSQSSFAGLLGNLLVDLFDGIQVILTS